MGTLWGKGVSEETIAALRGLGGSEGLGGAAGAP